ncbi:MAG: CoA transferase [Alphaproteobacteria bacterium]|nr:CoA transferase [Alphaproteobacteria bacterium]
MAGPLDGIRVIDFTQMIAGPLATMTLADQGADVIKVEPPAYGDHSRLVATQRNGFSASFVNNNRNKRSVVLDLKDPDGLAAAHRLIAGADVVVQNFRAGVAERIGIGEAKARELNGRIIYTSMTGFGFSGPYVNKPVFDPLIQAASGLTTVQAGSDEQRPRLVRTILPDKLTGVQAAQAISAALFARERTGKGQHIQLSMLDTVVAFLWSSDMGGHTFIGDELEHERAQSFIDLIYETADGHVSVAVMQNKEWLRFTEALDKPELRDDPRFVTAALREENKDARLEAMQDAIKGYTSAEIIERLEAADVPCAPVLTRREMIRHPQIEANGLIVENSHPIAGPLRQTRPPARFSETSPEYRFGAPLLGQDTSDVLAEAGYSAAEIDALIEKGTARQANLGEAQGAMKKGMKA